MTPTARRDSECAGGTDSRARTLAESSFGAERRVDGGRLCDGRELEVRAPFDAELPSSTLRAELRAPRALDIDGARLAVWRAAGENGTTARIVGVILDPEDASAAGRIDFEVDGLRQDSYEVELAIPGAPRSKLGPVALIPGQPLMLDAEEFEPAAKLQLEARPRASGTPRNARLVDWAADVLLVSEPFDIAIEQTLAAAPGDYALVDAASLRPIATVELPTSAVRLRRDNGLEPLSDAVR